MVTDKYTSISVRQEGSALLTPVTPDCRWDVVRELLPSTDYDVPRTGFVVNDFPSAVHASSASNTKLDIADDLYALTRNRIFHLADMAKKIPDFRASFTQTALKIGAARVHNQGVDVMRTSFLDMLNDPNAQGDSLHQAMEDLQHRFDSIWAKHLTAQNSRHAKTDESRSSPIISKGSPSSRATKRKLSMRQDFVSKRAHRDGNGKA
jgi:hypothetical protein